METSTQGSSRAVARTCLTRRVDEIGAAHRLIALFPACLVCRPAVGVLSMSAVLVYFYLTGHGRVEVTRAGDAVARAGPAVVEFWWMRVGCMVMREAVWYGTAGMGAREVGAVMYAGSSEHLVRWSFTTLLPTSSGSRLHMIYHGVGDVRK